MDRIAVGTADGPGSMFSELDTSWTVRHYSHQKQTNLAEKWGVACLQVAEVRRKV